MMSSGLSPVSWHFLSLPGFLGFLWGVSKMAAGQGQLHRHVTRAIARGLHPKDPMLGIYYSAVLMGFNANALLRSIIILTLNL